MNIPESNHPKGFMLLEVLLAFAILAVSVTGIVIALNRTAELSHSLEREMNTTRTLRNLMVQTIHTPVNEEDFVRDETYNIDDFTTARVLVEEFAQVDDDEDELNDLYKITVSIRSEVDGQAIEDFIETIHYRPLSQ